MSLLDIFSLGEKIIDKVLPDPQAKRDALFKLQELQQQGELAELAAETQLATGQLEINKEEAKSSNLFVAGWRPGFGWCGVAVVAWHYIAAPALTWIVALFGSKIAVPDANVAELWPLMAGILGIGGLRTLDKMNGTTTSIGGVVLTPVHKAEAPAASTDPQATAVPVAAPKKKRRWL